MVMLDQLNYGEIGRIVKFEGDTLFRKRFLSSGIFEGCFIRMISNSGSVTVEVNNKLFAIGKSMVRKIRVIKINTFNYH